MMNRLHQLVLIGSTLLGSWLGMQAVHESGHVIGAWMTGGRVERVVLHPLTISRTDLAATGQRRLLPNGTGLGTSRDAVSEGAHRVRSGKRSGVGGRAGLPSSRPGLLSSDMYQGFAGSLLGNLLRPWLRRSCDWQLAHRNASHDDD